jgi:hypothetical protein
MPGVTPGREEGPGMNRIKAMAAAAAMLVLTLGVFATAASPALAAPAHASRAMAPATTTSFALAGTAQAQHLRLKVTSREISSSGSTVYTYTEITACNDSCSVTVTLYFHATLSTTQVWINGKVTCDVLGAKATWCGNTNNGKNYLDTGVNFDGYWLRADVYPQNHNPGCIYRGDAPYEHWVHCEE